MDHTKPWKRISMSYKEGVLKHGKAVNEEMFELNEELYEVKFSCMYDLSMPGVLMSIALRTRGECVAYSSSIIWQRFQEELNEELCEVKISCAEPFVNGMSLEVHCIEKHGEKSSQTRKKVLMNSKEMNVEPYEVKISCTVM
ncbi:hypothetical protein R3W88_030178 [Solanum pinnatisectum]|uniref:Uncharacterized protein n=1 Tax=Solanum pinnatisectum TaxID=50273 RepID=A0AAV9K7E5_9SOLN|nr:hypothetical protein R3W88_030178 [Solanum pinnatisectum]